MRTHHVQLYFHLAEVSVLVFEHFEQFVSILHEKSENLRIRRDLSRRASVRQFGRDSSQELLFGL